VDAIFQITLTLKDVIKTRMSKRRHKHVLSSGQNVKKNSLIIDKTQF